jgi:hypothetical protein
LRIDPLAAAAIIVDGGSMRLALISVGIPLKIAESLRGASRQVSRIHPAALDTDFGRVGLPSAACTQVTRTGDNRMAEDPCQHGMARAGCSYCSGTLTLASMETVAGPRNGRSKQRLLDDVCDLLGVARHAATPGSNPSRVFAAAAASAKVRPGSMPKIGAAIAAKAGLAWGPQCDNRAHHVEATMVTTEGIAVVRQALSILAERRQQRPNSNPL